MDVEYNWTKGKVLEIGAALYLAQSKVSLTKAKFEVRVQGHVLRERRWDHLKWLWFSVAEIPPMAIRRWKHGENKSLETGPTRVEIMETRLEGESRMWESLMKAKLHFSWCEQRSIQLSLVHYHSRSGRFILIRKKINCWAYTHDNKIHLPYLYFKLAVQK